MNRPPTALRSGSNLALFRRVAVNLTVIVHNAEEGGYWAEVPAIPRCATQGDTWEELLSNIGEAVQGCLAVPVDFAQTDPTARAIELAV